MVLNLLRNDPTSRRIIMTSYNPASAKDGVLYPCHGIAIQFYVRIIENIKYVSDRLLVQLGFNKIYYCNNPFDFMVNINLDGKTNFFEARTSEYIHSSVLAPNGDSWNFGEEDTF